MQWYIEETNVNCGVVTVISHLVSRHCFDCYFASKLTTRLIILQINGKAGYKSTTFYCISRTIHRWEDDIIIQTMYV